MGEIIYDILLDASIDTLKTIPFLFAAYFLLEFIEHKSAGNLSKILSSGKFGIPGGAILGCIPQCGMGIATSHLFAAGTVGAGTLIAVFISTSDEAVPIILSHPDKVSLILPLLLVKIAVAVIAGYIFDYLFSKKSKKLAHVHNDDHDCHGCSEIEHAHEHDCSSSCEHNIFISSIKRTLEVFLYIFIFNIIMGFIIHYVGADKISDALQNSYWFQPVIASLVGLIPNCAASVALTELLVDGSISFGAAVAGLSTGAGLGYIALFRTNKNIKENFAVLSFIFVISAAFGMLLQLLTQI